MAPVQARTLGKLSIAPHPVEDSPWIQVRREKAPSESLNNRDVDMSVGLAHFEAPFQR